MAASPGFEPKNETQIDLADESELQGWANRLGVSVPTLRRAAEEVGIEIESIKDRLQIVVRPPE